MSVMMRLCCTGPDCNATWGPWDHDATNPEPEHAAEKAIDRWERHSKRKHKHLQMVNCIYEIETVNPLGVREWANLADVQWREIERIMNA